MERLTQDEMIMLVQMIRKEFESLKWYEGPEIIISIARKLGLDELVKELKSDIKI